MMKEGFDEGMGEARASALHEARSGYSVFASSPFSPSMMFRLLLVSCLGGLLVGCRNQAGPLLRQDRGYPIHFAPLSEAPQLFEQAGLRRAKAGGSAAPRFHLLRATPARAGLGHEIAVAVATDQFAEVVGPPQRRIRRQLVPWIERLMRAV